MSNLNRFLEAQEDDYERALKEIKKGKKSTCWMWYVFPQITGLGMSSISEKYAIKNMDEAIDYLKHDTLRERLIEISQALLDLDNTDTDMKEIMGFPDNLKLKSSMTLFKEAEEISKINCDGVFQKVLDKYFDGEPDNKTLRILEKQKFEELKNKNKKKEIIINEKKDEVIDTNKQNINESKKTTEDNTSNTKKKETQIHDIKQEEQKKDDERFRCCKCVIF